MKFAFMVATIIATLACHTSLSEMRMSAKAVPAKRSEPAQKQQVQVQTWMGEIYDKVSPVYMKF